MAIFASPNVYKNYVGYQAIKNISLLSIITIVLVSMTNAYAKPIALESGVYENVLLAVNPNGAVTGHYREAQGEGIVKTCAFTFKGKAHAGKANIIVGEENAFSGEIQAKTESIKLKIIKGRELPGCGLVLTPEITDGLSYDLTNKTSWNELRIITSEKSYFYSASKADKKLKSYLVKGDVVGVVTKEGDWLQIDYYSGNGKMRRHWINSKETASLLSTQ